MFQQKRVAAFSFTYFVEGKSSENSVHFKGMIIGECFFTPNSKKLIWQFIMQPETSNYIDPSIYFWTRSLQNEQCVKPNILVINKLHRLGQWVLQSIVSKHLLFNFFQGFYLWGGLLCRYLLCLKYHRSRLECVDAVEKHVLPGMCCDIRTTELLHVSDRDLSAK